MSSDPVIQVRLMIEDIKDAEVVTSYTRWVDAVQVREGENQKVYLTFSPRFERQGRRVGWLRLKCVRHFSEL